jgi:EmrB/QacA subfamily drug resistance transporter
MGTTATTGIPNTFLSTRHGKLILALVCAAGFLDVIDTTIVNIALPSIREHVHFSLQSLQWTASGYLLTYGGFLLLGGRAADLLGRRRVFVAGTLLFGLSSLVCGAAGTETILIGARLSQGLGAAMMTPAALSILTTSFSGETDRTKAIGLWSATIPLGAVIGVLAGGLLTQGPGWRWVFFVNLPVCSLVLAGAFTLLADDRRHAPANDFDAVGAVLSTAGMLLLVYAFVPAPNVGWASIRTIAELATAGCLLAVFVAAELRHRNPLFPLSILRIKGLAAADATQVIAQAGFHSMFFFVTLYMQNVLGFSPIAAGAAYVPVTVGVGLATGVASKVLPRSGSRPVIITGAVVGAAGVYWLSRIPVHGSYAADVLPGLVVMAFGLGAIFVGVQTAANAGVPADKAGLAAALGSASAQLGSALGLAVFSAIAASHTQHMLASHVTRTAALTGGFQHALNACSLFLVAAGLIAARASKTTHRQAANQALPRSTSPCPPRPETAISGTVIEPCTSSVAGLDAPEHDPECRIRNSQPGEEERTLARRSLDVPDGCLPVVMVGCVTKITKAETPRPLG